MIIAIIIGFLLLCGLVWLVDSSFTASIIISVLGVGLCIWIGITTVRSQKKEENFIKKENEFLRNNNALGTEYFKTDNNSHKVIIGSNTLYARNNYSEQLGSLWCKNDIVSISITIEHGNKIVDYTDSWAAEKAGLQAGLLSELGIGTIWDASDFADKKVNEDTVTVTIHFTARINGRIENLKGYAVSNQPLRYESTQRKLQEAKRFVDAVNDMLESDQYNSPITQSIIQQEKPKKEPPKVSQETTTILNKTFLGVTIAGAIGLAIILGLMLVSLILYGEIRLYFSYPIASVLKKISMVLMIIGFCGMTTKLVLCFKFQIGTMPTSTTKKVMLILLDFACLVFTIYTIL